MRGARSDKVSWPVFIVSSGDAVVAAIFAGLGAVASVPVAPIVPKFPALEAAESPTVSIRAVASLEIGEDSVAVAEPPLPAAEETSIADVVAGLFSTTSVPMTSLLAAGDWGVVDVFKGRGTWLVAPVFVSEDSFLEDFEDRFVTLRSRMAPATASTATGTICCVAIVTPQHEETRQSRSVKLFN